MLATGRLYDSYKRKWLMQQLDGSVLSFFSEEHRLKECRSKSTPTCQSVRRRSRTRTVQETNRFATSRWQCFVCVMLPERNDPVAMLSMGRCAPWNRVGSGTSRAPGAEHLGSTVMCCCWMFVLATFVPAEADDDIAAGVSHCCRATPARSLPEGCCFSFLPSWRYAGRGGPVS